MPQKVSNAITPMNEANVLRNQTAIANMIAAMKIVLGIAKTTMLQI